MFKNAGKLEERDKVGGDFTPFKKGEYILTVQDTELGDTDEMVWVGRVAQPTGNKIPQLTLKSSGDEVLAPYLSGGRVSNA